LSPGISSTIGQAALRHALAAHAAGALMPLKTREGVAEAPIEPGARTLCEPCDFGPAWKLWRLIVPWKPLPFETPATLTSLADLEALDGHGRRPSARRPRRGTHDVRSGGAPAFLRWPSSGFVSAFSRTAPKPSWTAS
jgi:hypothetical protein